MFGLFISALCSFYAGMFMFFETWHGFIWLGIFAPSVQRKIDTCAQPTVALQPTPVKYEHKYDRAFQSASNVFPASVDADEYKQRLIQNYVIEPTPIGNVIMRFHAADHVFEYYSDKTIPYRFLESIGKKYVIMFRCKPIFVDSVAEFEKSKARKDALEKILKENPGFEKHLYDKCNASGGKKDANEFAVSEAQKKYNQLQAIKRMVPAQSNHYRRIGSSNDFSPIQRDTSRSADANMSFAAFKQLVN